MARKRYLWKLRDRELQLGDRTLIVAILNVTPDSFSDGGKYIDPDRAFARALELEEQGADIIDIGAESMRPGSTRVGEAEEKRRLIPVLKRVRNRLAVPVMVDTYKSGVAENALDLGVDAINDPTGVTSDPLLAKVAVKYNAGLVLNHMRGSPESWAKLPPVPDIISLVGHELHATVRRAQLAGVDRTRMVIDPGIGFGKRGEQNSELLARLGALAQIDLPILAGPSRKQFLKQATERGTEFATSAAVAAAILGGAHLVRVHDVEAGRAAASVADAILRTTPE